MSYEQLEYGSDLIRALPGSGNDKPVYARRDGQWFVIEAVEETEREAEDVVVLVLREVSV